MGLGREDAAGEEEKEGRREEKGGKEGSVGAPKGGEAPVGVRLSPTQIPFCFCPLFGRGGRGGGRGGGGDEFVVVLNARLEKLELFIKHI